MEFRILGPLEVVDADGRRLSLPRGRARRLLAMLVVNVGEVVPTDRLFDDLWHGAPPPTADKALQGLVSKLRKALIAGAETAGPLDAVIATRAPGYRLDVDPDRIDSERFRRQVVEAEALEATERATALRRALDLWRGPALDEFAHEPFAQSTIASLEEARVVAVEHRVAAELDAGRHAEVIGDLERLVTEHPFREGLWAQLMLALYRSGRQVDALEAYKDARRTLVDELGLEPSPVLQRLERAVLAHDPSLELDRVPRYDRTTASEPGAVSRSWLAETRQIVTVLFAGIEVTSRSASDTPGDSEASRPVLRRAHRLASEAVTRHGGSLEGFIGGVLVAVFGVPEVREDDAWRAVRAAVDLRDGLSGLDDDPAVAADVVARVGINSGEVVLGQPGIGPAAAAGHTVNLASALHRAAAEGELLISDATRRLVADTVAAEAIELTGNGGDHLRAWRLTGFAPDPPDTTGRRAAPIVGRDPELGAMRDLCDRVIREQRPGLCTVVGEAGIGKSRLALEFTAGLGDGVRVLAGRCRAHGEGAPFWPVRELIGDAVGGQCTVGAIASLMGQGNEAEVAAGVIATAIGLAVEGTSRGQLLPAVQRLFAGLAAGGPVVIVLEDVHWADPTLLELVDGARRSVRAPVLFLCLARPEFLEERRNWRTDGQRVLSLELGPLTRDESELLLAERLAGRTLERGLPERIVDLGQGNPLFLEQLAAATLETHGADPSAPGAAVGIGERTLLPASLRMLLVARMMRLGPAERDILRSAAVVGTGFTAGLLATLVPDTSRPFLERHLEVLVERNFLRTVERARPAVPSSYFEFVHALVQQAAYRSVTYADRAELHQRIADQLVERDEADELVGYHLERAYEQARASGADATILSDLAERAGERLAAAGLRAFGRIDFGGAENLLSRARTLLRPGHELRPEVLRRLVAASPAMGRFESAESALDELLDELPPDARAERRSVRLERLRIRMVKGPDPWRHKAFLTVGEQVLADAIAADDHVAASQANYLLSFVHWRAGRVADLERTAWAAVRHGAASGDLRELTGALWWPPKALVEGPTPVPEAIITCERLIADHHHHPGVLTSIAELHAMAGDIDLARELASRSWEEFAERIHVKRALAFVASRRAHVEVLAGEFGAAEAVLRDILDIALDVGERDQIARIAAALAWLLGRREAVEEGEEFLALAEEHLPSEALEARARTTLARARLRIARGEAEAATAPLGTMLGEVHDDLLGLRADLYVESGTALAAAGDHVGSEAAVEQARRLYERKGNVAALRRLEELVSGSPASVATTPG